MTIQDQIDQLKRELDSVKTFLGVKIKDHLTDTSKKVKSTRYYPNGAYMDEPEELTEYYYISEFLEEISGCRWNSHVMHRKNLEKQNCFPTKEAAEKDLRRQQLTAKMYRDMRDESINGDWVAGIYKENNHFPNLDENGCLEILKIRYEFSQKSPHDFYYKNNTFIEDLKDLGWTEEELKIVWFNN